MITQFQRGFSLLELLVALFVVVIITSLVTLGVNSGGREIELEAKVRSVADIASYALDEAQMRSVDMGLLLEQIDDNGQTAYRYSWRERTPRGWRRPDIDADIFNDQQFPPDIELLLELENTVVDILTPGEAAQNTSAGSAIPVEPAPQIIFYSSGEVTDGALDLRQKESGDLLWRLEWDLLGRFSVLRRGEVFDEEP